MAKPVHNSKWKLLTSTLAALACLNGCGDDGTPAATATTQDNDGLAGSTDGDIAAGNDAALSDTPTTPGNSSRATPNALNRRWALQSGWFTSGPTTSQSMSPKTRG